MKADVTRGAPHKIVAAQLREEVRIGLAVLETGLFASIPKHLGEAGKVSGKEAHEKQGLVYPKST